MIPPDEPPFFSIVIPCFNAAGSLAAAAESVFGQDGPVELILVDDGSTDATSRVVCDIRARTGRPVVHAKTENRGPSAARNLGAGLASGAYVLYLDADDVLLPGALAAFRAAIETHGHPDAVYGGFELQEETGPLKTYRAPPAKADARANFAAFLAARPRPLTPGNVCVRRDVRDRLAFPEHLRIAEDLVFFGQLLATGRAASLPQPVLRRFGIAGRGTDRAIRRADELIAAVDALFDPAILPAEAMALRRSQLGMTYLTLFRAFQAAGRHAEARDWYRKGLALAPARALRPVYLRKLVRSWLALPKIVMSR